MCKLNEASGLNRLVVGTDTKIPLVNGEWVTAVNFDNAATTPPLIAVMDDVIEFAPWYSSIHRGNGFKSVLSSNMYEDARNVIKAFVNADAQRDIVIYTKNATESINMLAYMLFAQDREQVILTTDMEHLANELPWRDKFKVAYVGINKYGELDLEDLKLQLERYQGMVKLVTINGASNVTGYINPIHNIARLVHAYGAKILVDGAQLVPHAAVDMKPYGSPEHIDFLVFSAHKMYAPFGVGVLIGPKSFFTNCPPVYQGGGDVDLVTRKFIEWCDPPAKHETGTPNLIGVLALKSAIEALNKIGMETIHAHETHLINYAIEGLRTIPEIRLYCHRNKNEARVSLISFNLDGIYHSVLAEMLAQEAGIAVRSGLFCAHPYVEKLLNISEGEMEHYHTYHDQPFPGLVRISFGLYNTCQEIDLLLTLLTRIAANKTYYLNKYKHLSK